MTFKEWFNSAPHRAKYSSDHPAYLAAQEAWEAAHEACANVCDLRARSYSMETDMWAHEHISEAKICADAIRARGQA